MAESCGSSQRRGEPREGGWSESRPLGFTLTSDADFIEESIDARQHLPSKGRCSRSEV